MTDQQRTQAKHLQSECDAFCLTLPKAQEPAINVNTDTPGVCRFFLQIIYKGQRLQQTAHVPMSMIGVMPREHMAGFVRELAEGAFQQVPPKEGADGQNG